MLEPGPVCAVQTDVVALGFGIVKLVYRKDGDLDTVFDHDALGPGGRGTRRGEIVDSVGIFCAYRN